MINFQKSQLDSRTYLIIMDPKFRPTSMQQKIMLLRSKFKSTEDTWVYLTERCKYLFRSV